METSTSFKKILVVEDEKPIARALELKLKKSGMDVLSAGNGVEALNLLNKQKFDLILLDLIMPEIDGFKVLEEMRKNKITTPVLVWSDLSQREDIKKAENLGANGYLVKFETSLAEVVEKVQELLNGSLGQAQAA